MSNTEIAIAVTGEIVLRQPLFTRMRPAAISPDEWRQLLDDITDREMRWSLSRRCGTGVFGWRAGYAIVPA
jgi:hypothetical protein